MALVLLELNCSSFIITEMAVCGKDKLLVYKYIIFNAVCTGLVKCKGLHQCFSSQSVCCCIYFENTV